MVRRGNSGRVSGGFRRRSGSHDHGLATRSEWEGGGPRGRERREERGALLLSREARPRTRLLGRRNEGGVGGAGPGHDAPLGRDRLQP